MVLTDTAIRNAKARDKAWKLTAIAIAVTGIFSSRNKASFTLTK